MTDDLDLNVIRFPAKDPPEASDDVHQVRVRVPSACGRRMVTVDLLDVDPRKLEEAAHLARFLQSIQAARQRIRKMAAELAGVDKIEG